MSYRLVLGLLATSAALSLAAGCSDDDSSSGGDGGSGAGVGTGAGTTTMTGGGGTGGSATGGSGGMGTGGDGATGGCGPDDAGPDEDLGRGMDPDAGGFTLDDALEGLPPGPGPLRAIFTATQDGNTLGNITCELYPEQTPNAVANFVGLVRGRRAWRDPNTNNWVRRRFYDGLIFHRVIPMFVIQGGDPLGTGFGNPGYQFADELATDVGLTHLPGSLAYANSGPNTNGSQFFITEVNTDFLDPDFTMFGGNCDPVSDVAAIAGVATNAQDKPLSDVTMQVEITRCAP